MFRPTHRQRARPVPGQGKRETGRGDAWRVSGPKGDGVVEDGEAEGGYGAEAEYGGGGGAGTQCEVSSATSQRLVLDILAGVLNGLGAIQA